MRSLCWIGRCFCNSGRASRIAWRLPPLAVWLARRLLSFGDRWFFWRLPPPCWRLALDCQRPARMPRRLPRIFHRPSFHHRPFQPRRLRWLFARPLPDSFWRRLIPDWLRLRLGHSFSQSQAIYFCSARWLARRCRLRISVCWLDCFPVVRRGLLFRGRLRVLAVARPILRRLPRRWLGPRVGLGGRRFDWRPRLVRWRFPAFARPLLLDLRRARC